MSLRPSTGFSPRDIRGFSLIESLVCLVIISILSTISVVTYQGALDQGDLKIALPHLAGQLDSLRRKARDEGYTIKVTFNMGGTTLDVESRKGEQVETTTSDLKTMGIIKRPLKFRKYEWPDGGSTPATYTFIGMTEPQGGKLIVGTGYAEGRILISGGRVGYELN